ncbi:MAG: CopG family transcriptional regulator [Chloroflexi bacterium]|nr:CopG family transcriptional regulator [Chloroflexota bacterium]
MQENGYAVQVNDVSDLTAVKNKYHIPASLQSCHTAVVDGYILEGHVPVTEIEQMLNERPDIAGLAVAGMPVGSPGMEVNGATTQPYDVVAFDEAGNMEVVASYK